MQRAGTKVECSHALFVDTYQMLLFKIKACQQKETEMMGEKRCEDEKLRYEQKFV